MRGQILQGCGTLREGRVEFLGARIDVPREVIPNRKIAVADIVLVDTRLHVGMYEYVVPGAELVGQHLGRALGVILERHLQERPRVSRPCKKIRRPSILLLLRRIL